MFTKNQKRVEKIIPIKTDIDKFFIRYLHIVRPLLKPHLSNGELRVFAELLRINNEYKNIKPELRGKLLFDYDNKIIIMDNLGISYNTLGNIFMSLRKKGYITGNTIKKELAIIPDKEFTISYKFMIQ